MKRAALARGKPLKRVGRRAASDGVLNDLAREVVFRRDGYRCARCGVPCVLTVPRKSDGWPTYPGFDWSHIHSRFKKSMQWIPENAVMHCKQCHEWFGHNPTLGGLWFAEKYPERMAFLALRAQTPQKFDRTLTELDLRTQLAKSEAERCAASNTSQEPPQCSRS